MIISAVKTNATDKVILESAFLLAEILPADGGRLARLYDKARACELIWSNPRTATVPRYYGCNYDDLSASGIEEAFPTVQPCKVDEASLPFFGEIWSIPWQWEELKGNSGPALRLTCQSPVYPAIVEKTYRFTDDHTLTASYNIRNTGTASFRYLFGVHPSFCVYPGTRLFAPGGEYEVYVAGPESQLGGRTFRWPICEGVDFTDTLPPTSKAFYNVLAMPVQGGYYGVTHPGANTGLRVDFDPGFFPCLSLWPIYGGWRGHNCIMSEIFTAWPATLDKAIENGSAYILPAGGEISTCVQYTVAGSPPTE